MNTDQRLEKLEEQTAKMLENIERMNRFLENHKPTYHKRFFANGRFRTVQLSKEDLLKEMEENN